MGEPMVERLVAAGYTVRTSTKRPDAQEQLRRRGVQLFDTPAEAEGVAQAVLVCVLRGAADVGIVRGRGVGCARTGDRGFAPTLVLDILTRCSCTSGSLTYLRDHNVTDMDATIEYLVKDVG